MNFEEVKKNKFKTTEDIVWGVGKKDDPHPVTIEKGFEFDISVPWYLTWFIARDEQKFLFPSAVHDWFLANGYRRAFADSQWFEACLKVKAPEFKRNLAYIFMVIRSVIKGL